LLSVNLAVLRNTGQVFHRIFPNWDLSDIFLMMTLGLWVWGRKTTQAKCPSHHIIVRIQTIDIYELTLMLTFIPRLRQCLPVLYCKVIFFSEVTYYVFWKEVIKDLNPYLRSGELCSTSLKAL
jgi:hypothetical protein